MSVPSDDASAPLANYLRLSILDQCRLAYQAVGDAEGTDAADLRRSFARRVTAAMAAQRGLTPGTAEYSRAVNKRGSASGSISIIEQAVTFRVNTWKYMLRAGVEPSRYVADAAYALANATVASKEKFVAQAIREIHNGADPERAFLDAAEAVKAAVRARKVPEEE